MNLLKKVVYSDWHGSATWRCWLQVNKTLVESRRVLVNSLKIFIIKDFFSLGLSWINSKWFNFFNIVGPSLDFSRKCRFWQANNNKYIPTRLDGLALLHICVCALQKILNDLVKKILHGSKFQLLQITSAWCTSSSHGHISIRICKTELCKGLMKSQIRNPIF